MLTMRSSNSCRASHWHAIAGCKKRRRNCMYFSNMISCCLCGLATATAATTIATASATATAAPAVTPAATVSATATPTLPIPTPMPSPAAIITRTLISINSYPSAYAYAVVRCWGTRPSSRLRTQQVPTNCPSFPTFSAHGGFCFCALHLALTVLAPCPRGIRPGT